MWYSLLPISFQGLIASHMASLNSKGTGKCSLAMCQRWGQIWWSASNLFHRSALWKSLQSKNLALCTFISPATRKIFGSQLSAEKTWSVNREHGRFWPEFQEWYSFWLGTVIRAKVTPVQLTPLPHPKQSCIQQSGLEQVGRIPEKLPWCLPFHQEMVQPLTLPTSTCLLKRSTA